MHVCSCVNIFRLYTNRGRPLPAFLLFCVKFPIYFRLSFSSLLPPSSSFLSQPLLAANHFSTENVVVVILVVKSVVTYKVEWKEREVPRIILYLEGWRDGSVAVIRSVSVFHSVVLLKKI